MTAALIWYRHGENIQRLIAGTKPTIPVAGAGVLVPVLVRHSSRFISTTCHADWDSLLGP